MSSVSFARGEVCALAIVNAIREAFRPYYLRCLYFPFKAGARPQVFADCWRYPHVALHDASKLLAGLSDAPGCGVVFYSMNDWHYRTQRPQQLARALANIGHRVIYLNPHMGREFRRLRLFDGNHYLSRIEDNVLELHVRLPREPVFHERTLLPYESRMIADAVREAAERTGVKEIVQVVGLPIWMDAAVQVRDQTGSPVVYDCHDHLAGLPKMAAAVAKVEGTTLRRADCVLFSSDNLKVRHEGVMQERCSVLLRNAAEAPLQAPAKSPRGNRGRPIAGYVGALATWFDAEAIRRAAEVNPDIDFVLAGKVELDEIRDLSSLSNVSLLGEVPHTELSALYRSFDVGLIPFRLNELTRATNPVKFYEYCAHALPIVSTPLPELQPYADVIHFASGPEEFASQVRRSLESDERRRKRGLEIAARETWLARAHVLSNLFSQLLSVAPIDSSMGQAHRAHKAE